MAKIVNSISQFVIFQNVTLHMALIASVLFHATGAFGHRLSETSSQSLDRVQTEAAGITGQLLRGPSCDISFSPTPSDWADPAYLEFPRMEFGSGHPFSDYPHVETYYKQFREKENKHYGFNFQAFLLDKVPYSHGGTSAACTAAQYDKFVDVQEQYGWDFENYCEGRSVGLHAGAKCMANLFAQGETAEGPLPFTDYPRCFVVQPADLPRWEDQLQKNRETKTFYQWTTPANWKSIQEQGYLRRTDADIADRGASEQLSAELAAGSTTEGETAEVLAGAFKKNSFGKIHVFLGHPLESGSKKPDFFLKLGQDRYLRKVRQQGGGKPPWLRYSLALAGFGSLPKPARASEYRYVLLKIDLSATATVQAAADVVRSGEDSTSVVDRAPVRGKDGLLDFNPKIDPSIPQKMNWMDEEEVEPYLRPQYLVNDVPVRSIRDAGGESVQFVTQVAEVQISANGQEWVPLQPGHDRGEIV